ncbi:MAG: tetratricopeptide repeat protein [Candidatus Acidiferrales bacterium]
MVRGFLALDLALCVYLVVTQGVAAWYAGQDSPDAIQQAIQWDPYNPSYYVDLGRQVEHSFKAGNVKQAIELYEQSATLSPHNADSWAALGYLYEWDGQVAKAQAAYERAGRLFPESVVINWKIGNFYLRQGNLDLAFPPIQKAMTEDQDIARSSFDLVWRASDDPRVIEAKLLPQRSDLLLAYLDYLASTDRMEDANRVWKTLLERGFDPEPRAAFPYLDALIQHRQTGQLRNVWDSLERKNPSASTGQAAGANLITNGDFESRILNGGLDWRISPTDGVVVSVDSVSFFDGTHSLRIRFDGKHNPDYQSIFQYVPVTPNTTYRFTGYLRVQDLTTDSGMEFQCYDADETSKPVFETDNLSGTTSWLPQQSEFTTGPNTRLLLLRMIRPASHKFENLISGTAWVDRISLNEVD